MQTAGALDTIEMLKESLADIQRVMDRDQAGWAELGSLDDNLGGFTHDFRNRQAARILVAMAANPLIKRGTNLRAAYIWGSGVEISVQDKPDQGQDVNAVVQAFLDDPANAATFANTDARIEWERDLAYAGEVALCLPTDPITGRVRVRKLPVSQITEIIADPEDESTEWLYLREWADSDGNTHAALYPALGYHPATRDRSRRIKDRDIQIRWDQPVRLVRVNKIKNRGLGDAFAAVPWADAYKRFLEDWLRVANSLSRFAWKASTRGDKTAEIAARMTASIEAGQGVALDPNSRMEAISKSGATINADSGRPAAAMIAAALDLPVTVLLSDPGVTGARAVATDVTESSWAVFDVRRDLWRTVLRDVCAWVIDSAVIAPAGALRGTIRRDGDRRYADLPEGDGRTIEVVFPARDSESLVDRIKAIQIADQSEKLPPLTMARMYLDALGVRHVDEVLDLISDDEGNFVPLDVIDLRARAALRAAGEYPIDTPEAAAEPEAA